MTWVLSSGHGEKEVSVRIRNVIFTELAASDRIISEEGLFIIFEDGVESGSFSAWTEVVN